MIHIALYQPEIPPNTGNVIRLCANIGAQLHLIRPLGFEMDDKRLRRAGLDYHEWASVITHDSYQDFSLWVQTNRLPLFGLSTKGTVLYTDVSYPCDAVYLFGPETRGLPDDVLQAIASGHLLRLPMKAHSRSLNLSNTVSIVAYHAWFQRGFE